MEKDFQVTLIFRDFWNSHPSDYFPNYKGDVTKSFLADLGERVVGSHIDQMVFTSVYKKNSLHQRVSNRMRKSRIQKLELQYGRTFSSKPKENEFNVWYTAENIRPPLDKDFDAYLSFDLDSYSGLNSYLPLWLCRLGPTVEQVMRVQNELTQQRQIDGLRPKNFAVVASNPEQIRKHFAFKLNEKEEVSIFGKMGLPIPNKDLALRNFNFNICFENDLYPGYVTEKAVESYLSGCIPIWRGNDSGGFFNKNAMIDVTKLSIEEGVKKVIEISKDKVLIQTMRTEPLLVKNISIEQIISNLREKFYSR
jgi:hypothetical protein